MSALEGKLYVNEIKVEETSDIQAKVDSVVVVVETEKAVEADGSSG